MVGIRLKAGPKGQIVIPKVFKEAYGIKEDGEVVVKPTNKGVMIMPDGGREELIKESSNGRTRELEKNPPNSAS